MYLNTLIWVRKNIIVDRNLLVCTREDNWVMPHTNARTHARTYEYARSHTHHITHIRTHTSRHTHHTTPHHTTPHHTTPHHITHNTAQHSTAHHTHSTAHHTHTHHTTRTHTSHHTTLTRTSHHNTRTPHHTHAHITPHAHTHHTTHTHSSHITHHTHTPHTHTHTLITHHTSHITHHTSHAHTSHHTHTHTQTYINERHHSIRADSKIRKQWEDESSEVHHLTNETFRDFIKDQEVLVMFYAPWCGHCNSMKPAYVEAAKLLKDDHFPAVLAAIDATKARNISKEENVKGYPTRKFTSLVRNKKCLQRLIWGKL